MKLIIVLMISLSAFRVSAAPAASGCEPLLIGSFRELVKLSVENQSLAAKDLYPLLKSKTPVNPLNRSGLTSDQYQLKIAIDKRLRGLDSSQWQAVQIQLQQLIQQLDQDSQTKQDSSHETRLILNPRQITAVPFSGGGRFIMQSSSPPTLLIAGPYEKAALDISNSALTVKFGHLPWSEPPVFDYNRIKDKLPELKLEQRWASRKAYPHDPNDPQSPWLILLEIADPQASRKTDDVLFLYFHQGRIKHRIKIEGLSLNQPSIQCLPGPNHSFDCWTRGQREFRYIHFSENGIENSPMQYSSTAKTPNSELVVPARLSDDRVVAAIASPDSVSIFDAKTGECIAVHGGLSRPMVEWMNVDEQNVFMIIHQRGRPSVVMEPLIHGAPRAPIPGSPPLDNEIAWTHSADGQIYLAFEAMGSSKNLGFLPGSTQQKIKGTEKEIRVFELFSSSNDQPRR